MGILFLHKRAPNQNVGGSKAWVDCLCDVAVDNFNILGVLNNVLFFFGKQIGKIGCHSGVSFWFGEKKLGEQCDCEPYSGIARTAIVAKTIKQNTKIPVFIFVPGFGLLKREGPCLADLYHLSRGQLSASQGVVKGQFQSLPKTTYILYTA